MSSKDDSQYRKRSDTKDTKKKASDWSSELYNDDLKQQENNKWVDDNSYSESDWTDDVYETSEETKRSEFASSKGDWQKTSDSHKAYQESSFLWQDIDYKKEDDSLLDTTWSESNIDEASDRSDFFKDWRERAAAYEHDAEGSDRAERRSSKYKKGRDETKLDKTAWKEEEDNGGYIHN